VILMGIQKKVVICYYEHPHVDYEKEILKDAGLGCEEYRIETNEDISDLVGDADALLVQHNTVGPKVIDNMKKCKIIVRYGIGYDNLDVKYAEGKGIYCCNVPDYCIDEVSDHAISLLLNLARGISRYDRAKKSEAFSFAISRPIHNFRDLTVGIVGVGRIGKATARKLGAFGFRLLGTDPHVNKETMEALGIEKNGFEEICRRSDFITLHCMLNDETRHMFGFRQFDMMKSTAFIINTSRGPVIDEGKLIKALQEKKIAGAGLDVFEIEPIQPENGLLQLDNVLLTPHAAWYSEKSIIELKKKAALEAVRVLKGETPLNPVNAPCI
jgi:D-3-phosphoglycerate dehydrogenase